MLSAAWEKLYALGFIKPVVGEKSLTWTFTRMGALATRFPRIKPELLRMILAGYFWEYSVPDLITIAAYLIWLEEGSISVPGGKIDWLSVYQDGMPPYLFRDLRDAALYTYKVRLILCDEFIDGLLLWRSASSVLKSAPVDLTMDALEKWCEEKRVLFSGIIGFMKYRDDLFEQMIMAGLNPFKYKNNSIMNVDEKDFMNTVTKIKYCIYDGFRLNTLTFVPETNSYISNRGIRVEIPSMFADNEKNRKKLEDWGLSMTLRPRYLLYYSLVLKFNEKTRDYKVKAGKVSAMDGYVTHDDLFLG
jgi:hypothetical protein